jgi:hypothetical protein
MQLQGRSVPEASGEPSSKLLPRVRGMVLGYASGCPAAVQEEQVLGQGDVQELTGLLPEGYFANRNPPQLV